ncbi:hypothetical protein Glove_441g109 [Diversispora epigaea]|uniref:DUF304 domain-containing protein n=1 Tax=Diversispora epigaea TaxID=1348612 RepID=A0A397GT97_9GLOM|nr:hypothetical protein Glove_441g109 [Diversispora epigaea]
MSQKENIIWEGTTWPCGIFSPCCCSTVHWKITDRRIDYTAGCCGSTQGTLDVRAIKDLTFHRSVFQFLTCRGTLTIISGDATDPVIHISTYGMQETYRKLRDTWSDQKVTYVRDRD